MPVDRPNPDPAQRRKMSAGLESLVEAEKLLQIAILLPSAAFIGWLGGAWLDNRLHQSWIGPTGIVLGGVAGIVHVIRLVMAAGNKSGVKGPTGTDGGKGSSDQNS